MFSAEKQDNIRKQFLDCFIDPDSGLVFSQLDKNTRKPMTDDFFGGAKFSFGVDSASLREIELYENFGMCTGAFITSEVLRYERLKDQSSLDNARSCLLALKRIYDIGATRERGYFPKPYGNRISDQVSSDQYLYAIFAIDKYMPYASAEDKVWLSDMLDGMVKFWVEKDYRFRYFNFFGDDWQWPLNRFAPFSLIAWKHTKDEYFLREYQKMIKYTEKPEGISLWRKINGVEPLWPEEEGKDYYLTCHCPDRITMGTMEHDIMLCNDPDNEMHSTWLFTLERLLDEAKDAFTPDGYCHNLMKFDRKTLRGTPVLGSEVGIKAVHGAPTAWSTMIVRAEQQISRFLPETAARVKADTELVLGQLDFDKLTYEAHSPSHKAAGKEYNAKMLSGDAVSNYLWAGELYLQTK